MTKSETTLSDGFVTLQNDDIIPLSEFKGEFVSGHVKSEDAAMVTKFFTFEIDSTVKGDEESRKVGTIISDGKVDRQRDVIQMDGWNLASYEKNPVVLWSHDYYAPPIARSVITATKTLLKSVDEFATAEQYEFAETIFQLVKGGFINAKSVGMRPGEMQWNEKRGGFDFTKGHDLLEHSYVPVPANPRALIVARSQGVNLEPLRMWAEKSLDCGLWVPGGIDPMILDIKGKSYFVYPKEIQMGEDNTDMGKTDNTDTSKIDNVNITFDTSDDDEEVSGLHLSKSAEKRLQDVLTERTARVSLAKSGFNEGQIDKLIEELRGMEDDEEIVTLSVEDEEGFDLDELKSLIADEIEDAKSSWTSLTGEITQ